MATFKKRPIVVTVKATLELDEEELAALDALTGYGADKFLQVFYGHLGRHYMQPHEDGLRRLFASIRHQVPGILSDARTARTQVEQTVKPKANALQ